MLYVMRIGDVEEVVYGVEWSIRMHKLRGCRGILSELHMLEKS